jgi:two-component system, NarL family, nitrate/nitrite response regulator NarL
MNTSAPIAIVIADDHPIFRDGLLRLLEAESDFRVVGSATDGYEAVTLVRSLKPDILLLDLAMPREPGAVRTILLTAAIEDAQKVAALLLGARGVVLKEAASSVLLECIRRVMAGDYWVDREPVASLADSLRLARTDREERPRFGLTRRQIEIVKAIAGGATNRDIAARLGIREDTVKQHLTSIFEKCGVSNRLELALFALQHQLVEKD